MVGTYSQVNERSVSNPLLRIQKYGQVIVEAATLYLPRQPKLFEHEIFNTRGCVIGLGEAVSCCVH